MWTWLTVLADRTRGFFSPKASDDDFDEELQSHVDMLTEQHVARGMSREDAARAARLRLGGVAQLKETHREQRGLPIIEALLQDVRYALRGFRRSPAFTTVAVATLALGIGANTAMYSVVDATLLRPLPYKDPARLMQVSLTTEPRGPVPGGDMAWSYPKYEAFARIQEVFEATAVYRGQRQSLTGIADPEQLQIEQVSASYFPLLGVDAALGRMFRADEDVAPQDQFPAVISDGLWKRRFGSDSSVVGRTLQLDLRPYTIVGVMPPGFHPLTGAADVWMPAHAADPGDLNFFDSHSFRVVARLKPGVPGPTASAAVTSIGATLDQMFAGPVRGWGAKAVDLTGTRLPPAIRQAMLVLAAAVGLVLLIACVNIANLLLLRGTVRQREISIRLAIGAGRWRLMRQLLTESVLLALLGAAAGLVVAWAGIQALTALNPVNINVGGLGRPSGLTLLGFSSIRLDGAALLFTGVVAVLTGVIFGLAPARQASHAGLAEALKTAGTTRPSARPGRFGARNVLVVTEVALALVLLVGAGLMLRSFSKLIAIDPGVNADEVLMLRLSMPGAGPQANATFTTLTERIAATAGVRSVALADCAAVSGGCSRAMFDPVTGTQGTPGTIRTEIGIHIVSPGYLSAMQIRLVKGRWLTPADGRDQPKVAVVSELWAQQFWRGKDAIGQRMGISRPGFGRGVEVVGVVSDVRYGRLDEAPRPDVYVSYLQVNPPRPFHTMFVRASGDPLDLIPAVREQVRAAGSNLVIADLKTMNAHISDGTAQMRFNAVLLATFAGLALALAAVGIYGVMAYTVTEQTREIGIRVALGAGRGEVLRLVLVRGAALTAAGVALGVASALGVSRALTAMLYGVTPYDAATYLGISGLLAGVALVAVWVPARRATAVDAIVALRTE